jgi:transposase
VVLSAGEAHDVTAYDQLIEQRDSDPGAMLADKGYDSDAIRQDLRDRGATPEIPTKRNRKVQYSVSKPLYALRSRIECFIGHLKEQRRIATRYDKTASSFLGIVADQPDNAARVVARGAGVHVPPNAPPEKIGAAIQRVLNDRKFRNAAQQLGAAIEREGDAAGRTICAIEDVLAL